MEFEAKIYFFVRWEYFLASTL